MHMFLRTTVMGLGLVGLLGGGAGFWYFGNQQEEIKMHSHMKDLGRLHDTLQSVINVEYSYKHDPNLSQPIEQMEAAVNAEIQRLEALPEVKADKERLKTLQRINVGFVYLALAGGITAYAARQKDYSK